MRQLLFSVGVCAGLAVACLQVAVAQTAANSGSTAVNEAKARAVLAQDSIRCELPLTGPAIDGERAVAWLLSPTGTATSENSVALSRGSRSVTLTLPRPRDAKGKPADQIGWYRIGYRIEAGSVTAAHGILAIGAISPNLLELRMARPYPLQSGKPFSVRVYAGNPISREPFSGVHLEATLAIDADEDAKTAAQTIVRKAVTDRSGEAIVSFPMPARAGASPTLTVNGTLIGARGADSAEARATASVEADLDVDDRSKVYIETDKPLHKPGETVHLRMLVFDDTGHAAANTALTLTIDDPDEKDLVEVPLTTNRFGIAAYDWKTSAQLVQGDYTAKAELAGGSNYQGSAQTELRIQRYELPEFAVSVAMDSGYYLDGQTPVAHIHAGYLFGKPVAAGAVRVVRADSQQWNPKTGKWNEPDSVEQKATLDANGDAELRLDVKKDFDEFRGEDYERYSDVQYRAFVTDASTGRSEPRNFTVRLTRDPVHIYLTEAGGDDREADYIVSTEYADGRAVAAKVTLEWMDDDSLATQAARVTTSRLGLARVHLRFPSHGEETRSWKVRLQARDPEGRISQFDDTIYQRNPGKIWISVAHSLLTPNQTIEATIHGVPGTTIDIDVLGEHGEQLGHQQVQLTNAVEMLDVPATPAFQGIVTLHAYRMNGDVPPYHYRWDGDGSYKLVLYPVDRELKLKLSGLEASYLPGATVDAGIAVRNAAGLAAAGALGVSVIDTAVEQRAETEAEANERWFGWNWWTDDDDAAGMAREEFDRINLSQPISGDLDIAAEKMLVNAQGGGTEIEAESNDEARNAYEAVMKQDLKVLGDAVLAARTLHLPASMEEIRGIARNAKLKDVLLLDPWNTPYKAQVSAQYHDEVLSLVSAGPDKRFGTGDDFTIEVARRSIFALPGERLTKILKDAVRAGQSLPGTVDGLKKLALAGGLNLDSAQDGTLDMKGRPYQFQVTVSGRFYSVRVFTHEAKRPGESEYSSEDIWYSPPIDYFSAIDARIDTAIRDWAQAGNGFPETEADARKAFAAAGIDFDALRDPLGKPFRLRAIELMAYTRLEKVKAGAGLEEKSKPVTQRMKAIQVFRAEERPIEGTAGNALTQYLHPVTEQSGSDVQPQGVIGGTFKGNTGAIEGTVTDQTGAVISGAVVTVRNSENGIAGSAKADEQGVYLISDLEPGIYSVKVESKGFETFKVTELRVFAVALTTVDVMLRVGADSETVTVVSAAQAEVTTDSAEISTVVRTHSGRATISTPTFTPRLRHVFEETAYWAPSLETGANGRAHINFKLPDSLTTWKLHALASTTDGRIGVIDQTFKTFQPFFVDLDAPQVLTTNDEITLPVNLRNYTDHAMALPVTVKPSDWFTLLTPATVQATVASNSATPVLVGLRAGNSTEAGPLRITAANAHEGDAVEKTVRVHPDGEPRDVNASGLLRGGATTLTLDLPEDAIPGSVHGELLLYPNLGAHILHAMKAVLERPYGCGEQTLSSTYPSLIFLELLKAAKSTSPAEDEAHNYLQLGYDRLDGYFSASGGITYWGRSDETPDPALTAYGIEFLTEAEPYITVDRSRIESAVNWLVTSQQEDGSWKPHYGEPRADLNLYVAAELSRTLADEEFQKSAPKNLRDRAGLAVTRAVEWAAKSAAAVHDPYANALRLRLATDSAATAQLRAELVQTALHGKDGTHWSQAGYSPFYGWGHAGDLETTALVLAALRGDESNSRGEELQQDALYYLLRNQDRYGTWESGQATVLVLKALLPIAAEQLKTGGKAQQFQLAVNGVPLGAKDAEALATDPKLLDAPRTLDLSALLKPGRNELTFGNGDNSALASAEASASYYVAWAQAASQTHDKTQTGKDYGLDFGYHCAADSAKVGQPVDCSVSVRRFGSANYGMLLAEVGLPPGADVDRASLAKLLDDWTISRYELQPDRIIFYLWSWKAEGENFSFRFTPRYAIRAKAAPATLSDYYNPELKAVLAPQRFEVAASPLK
jgi:hypothetical protein